MSKRNFFYNLQVTILLLFPLNLNLNILMHIHLKVKLNLIIYFLSKQLLFKGNLIILLTFIVYPKFMLKNII